MLVLTCTTAGVVAVLLTFWTMVVLSFPSNLQVFCLVWVTGTKCDGCRFSWNIFLYSKGSFNLALLASTPVAEMENWVISEMCSNSCCEVSICSLFVCCLLQIGSGYKVFNWTTSSIAYLLAMVNFKSSFSFGIYPLWKHRF